tara:strand:+ start:21067 stop:21207 length:141 start_codon:yes stop_codon:yes gene_type:complete
MQGQTSRYLKVAHKFYPNGVEAGAAKNLEDKENETPTKSLKSPATR